PPVGAPVGGPDRVIAIFFWPLEFGPILTAIDLPNSTTCRRGRVPVTGLCLSTGWCLPGGAARIRLRAPDNHPAISDAIGKADADGEDTPAIGAEDDERDGILVAAIRLEQFGRIGVRDAGRAVDRRGDSPAAVRAPGGRTRRALVPIERGEFPAGGDVVNGRPARDDAGGGDDAAAVRAEGHREQGLPTTLFRP